MLVDRCRVQSDGLVVRDITPALPFASQKLRVEAPGNDGIDDDIVVAVEVVLLGNNKELPLSAS